MDLTSVKCLLDPQEPTEGPSAWAHLCGGFSTLTVSDRNQQASKSMGSTPSQHLLAGVEWAPQVKGPCLPVCPLFRGQG